MRPFIEISDCDYYKDLSDELGCSSKNYLNKFAYRYCAKFDKTAHRYTKESQEILRYIRGCLIHSMQEAAQNSSFAEKPLRCEDTEDVGFNSHVQCYVDGGFCHMNTRDKARIALAIKRELVHPRIYKIRREINRRCPE